MYIKLIQESIGKDNYKRADLIDELKKHTKSGLSKKNIPQLEELLVNCIQQQNHPIDNQEKIQPTAGKKKKQIPKAFRIDVWNKHHGDSRYAKCKICDSEISVTNFECGHSQSEANGGSNELNNFVAICSNCNKSQGTTHLDDIMLMKECIKKPKKELYLHSIKEISDGCNDVLEEDCAILKFGISYTSLLKTRNLIREEIDFVKSVLNKNNINIYKELENDKDIIKFIESIKNDDICIKLYENYLKNFASTYLAIYIIFALKLEKHDIIIKISEQVNQQLIE